VSNNVDRLGGSRSKGFLFCYQKGKQDPKWQQGANVIKDYISRAWVQNYAVGSWHHASPRVKNDFVDSERPRVTNQERIMQESSWFKDGRRIPKSHLVTRQIAVDRSDGGRHTFTTSKFYKLRVNDRDTSGRDRVVAAEADQHLVAVTQYDGFEHEMMLNQRVLVSKYIDLKEIESERFDVE